MEGQIFHPSSMKGQIVDPIFGQGNYTRVICYPTTQISSFGIWFGHDILFYSLPRVLLQMSTLIIVTRAVQILLQPLWQPTVVSDLIGGIMLGPSVLGNFPTIQLALFPDRGIFMMRTLLWFGAIYHMFAIGVKSNVSLLANGQKALLIASVGFVLPVVFVVGLYFLLRDHVVVHLAGGSFWAFMAAQLACTPFTVIQRFLSDFQLLNTEVGRLSLTVGMLNDVVVVALMLLVDISDSGQVKFDRVVYQLGALLFLVLFLVFVVRPLCFCLIRRTPEGKRVEQGYVVAILLGALNLGVGSNLLGLSVLEGPLLFGLVIPSGPPLGATLIEKIETINRNLLLPMFYATIGQRLNVFVVSDWTAFWIVVFLAVVSRLIKLLGTLISALGCRIPFRQALSIGLILCTRGFVDTMPYFIWNSHGVIDAQAYAAFVLVGIVVTMIASPIASNLSKHFRTYKPYVRRTIQHSKPQTELRLLVCIHDKENVPSILNILEVTNATPDEPICIYVMHLVELVGRAAPMLIAHKPNKKTTSGSLSGYSIFSAFHNYEQHHEGNILVQPLTSIAPYKTMHDDVCSVALQKKVSLIILPFYKQQMVTGSFYVVDNALQIINPNILAQAPCSVGVLVDRRGIGGRVAVGDPSTLVYRVGVLFFGGPDDREALSYAARMSEHPRVVLAVTRFVAIDLTMETMEEKLLDDELVSEFRVKIVGNEKISYSEIMVGDGEDAINGICSMDDDYDLMVVGRNQCFELDLVKGFSIWGENPDLGVIGDICSSSEFFGGKVSVLVMRQQTRAAADIEDGPS